MIRAAYFIGRILAALGAVLVVATLIVAVLSFANADGCSEPDCDDTSRDNAMGIALVLLPVSLLVGAAGMALINDTYRKVQ